MAADKVLEVTIITPEKELFKSEAKSVSSINSSGKFDILPQHAHFLTVIEDKPIIIRPVDGEPQEFKFALAIITVSDNNVKIFTDINLENLA